MDTFSSLSQFVDLLRQAPSFDLESQAAAKQRNMQLTKPAGALGRMEELAIWYAAWRGDARASISQPEVLIFAGNHGVTAQGISAFPAEVTEQMVLNFQAGGAAINQLSACFGAKLQVHSLELDRPTRDFTQGPAMEEDEFLLALQTGWNAVSKDCDLLVTGEMGIGNTTSAAAIAHALYGARAEDWVGRGTGVDAAGIAKKARVIAAGLQMNPEAQQDGLKALQCLGGRELAAMAGAIARARCLRIPVILDGFICCAAAACLQQISPSVLEHTVAGHESAEQAHKRVLAQLDKEPLLSLGMRLGEGSGAAVAIGILQAALACHSGMSTFAEAGVSDESTA
jgi:nicotinate-nucleotide--dimethylbenzimidazole phosphoribosyltransferase